MACCNKGTAGKSSGSSKKMPSNWGGMSLKSTGSKSMSGKSGGGSFGSPKVKMSFGGRRS